MQYLLNEEEYKELVDSAKHGKESPTKQQLQDLCTKVADHLPLNTWRGDGVPWQCIHSVQGEWYCDDCPVQSVCPERYKQWSK